MGETSIIKSTNDCPDNNRLQIDRFFENGSGICLQPLSLNETKIGPLAFDSTILDSHEPAILVRIVGYFNGCPVGQTTFSKYACSQSLLWIRRCSLSRVTLCDEI